MNKDLEFIKKFSKITISGICRKLRIDVSNLYNRKNPEKLKLVRRELEQEIKDLQNED